MKRARALRCAAGAPASPDGSLAMNRGEPWSLPIAVAIIAVSAVVCAGLILALRPLLLRYALARPNARSSHVVPTPQGAGIAVVAATLSLATAGVVLVGVAIPASLVAATVFLGFVGFADDIRSIPVLPRLLLQVIAVATVILTIQPDLRLVPACPLIVER